MKQQKMLNTNKGITLIALVITIIVMLILVSVTISMAINGGLFQKASEAGEETNGAVANEQLLASGQVTIGNVTYNSIDEYIKAIQLPIAYEDASFAGEFLAEKASYESDGYIAIIPKGFKVSEVPGENAIATGLVIKDAHNNEFVWIPVTEHIGTGYDFDENGEENGYYEPKELSATWQDSELDTKPAYDSQDILNELYGPKCYTITQGMYTNEYEKMVKSVNANDGFYIGRYETTIDNEGNIGSKYNTTVLTSATTLFTKDGTSYPYRWYGLYNELKRVNVSGNGTDVQSAMIYGVLWDKTMAFIREQYTKGNIMAYSVDEPHIDWHKGTPLAKSGQLNPGLTGDVALNIWDLESNASEWTQEAISRFARVIRGGDNGPPQSAAVRVPDHPTPERDLPGIDGVTARIILYLQ